MLSYYWVPDMAEVFVLFSDDDNDPTRFECIKYCPSLSEEVELTIFHPGDEDSYDEEETFIGFQIPTNMLHGIKFRFDSEREAFKDFLRRHDETSYQRFQKRSS